MPNSNTVDASREIQRVEARSRGNADESEADRELNQGALDTAGEDDPGTQQPPQPQPQPQPEPQQPKPVLSRFDQRRQDIINSFRKDRAEQQGEADENDDQIRSLSNDGLPPELTEAVDDRDEPGDDQAGEQQPQPDVQPEERKHKLLVRGKEILVTEAELREHAQKSIAHDDYLTEGRDEAKKEREEARRDREQARQLLERVQNLEGQRMPPGTHPAGQDAQPGEQPQPGDSATPADPYGELVDAIQFGDRETAIARTREFFQKQVPAMSAEQVRQSRLQAEWNNSMQVLGEFANEHQDIANDKKANAAIHTTMVDLQREDLKALGIPEEQLKDDMVVAQRHLAARTDRLNVRNPRKLLDTALDDYRAWRGTQSPTPQPGAQPPAQQHQPPGQQQPPTAQQPQPQQQRRVEVSLNREQRRAAIPQQPERTSAPRPQPRAPEQPQPKDRSDVVLAMKQKRDALKGKVGTV